MQGSLWSRMDRSIFVNGCSNAWRDERWNLLHQIMLFDESNTSMARSWSFSFANYHGDCRSVEALSTTASDETFLPYHGSGWCTSGLLTVSMGLLLVAFVSPSENRNGRFTASLGWVEWTICVVQPNRYHILDSPEKKRIDYFVSIGGHFSVLGCNAEVIFSLCAARVNLYCRGWRIFQTVISFEAKEAPS